MAIISLSGETFAPKYTLQGVYPIEHNVVNLYKVQPGISMDRTTPFLLFQKQIKITYEINYGKYLGSYSYKLNNRQLHNFPTLYRPVISFYESSFHTEFRKLLVDNAIELLQQKERATSGLIKDIVINLPSGATPKLVRKIMGGSEAARISLSGSQRLTVGYYRSKSNIAGNELQDNVNTDFNILQTLNLSLKGTIGQKIHVDVQHNTTSEQDLFSSPSTVKIYYEGLEDEVIKRIEGGDVSFQLTGSKFFGNAASSEGLFGIKTELEVGKLKITTIIGKEEAKKDVRTYKPGQQNQNSEKRSNDFIKDKYFYTVRPDSMFVLYDEVVDAPIPLGWHQNAIKMQDGVVTVNDLMYQATPTKDSTIYVYIDNGVPDDNDIFAILGKSITESDTMTYKFQRVLDFQYLDDWGMIKLNEDIGNTYTIGIAYHDRNGNPVGNVNVGTDEPIRVKIIRRREHEPPNEENTNILKSETWLYTARNRYSLGATNIQSEGFSLDVYDKETTDDKPNDKISAEVANNYTDSAISTYVDYLNINSPGDNVVNGDDRYVDLVAGIVTFPLIQPFQIFETVNIYGSSTINSGDVKTLIGIQGQVSADQISLGAINILPGSVTVKLDGSELKENSDYMVDYDFGTITLLSDRARMKTSELEVRYEYKPLFSLDNRTLIGVRADLDVNDNLQFGSTLVYQSEKVTDERPKIGSENRSMLMADFDTTIKFDPPLLTKMVDLLPFIKTDTDSEISITGEVAMSMPRIWGNKELGDKKQAFVEDMESILETFSLGISRTLWDPASKPINTFNNQMIESFSQGKMYWFNDDNRYRAKDIYDNLQDDEGDDKSTILACVINEMGEANSPNWQGIMRYVGSQIDFSKKNYIQVLAKVNPHESEAPVFMYIDLGQSISEDFYPPWDAIEYPDGPGNGDLDTEDANGNGNLDANPVDEDTGLDGVMGTDGSNIPEDDGDDDWNKNEVNGEYPYINRTEGNNRLDTEDLNRNSILDMSNHYAQYKIQLDESSPYYVSTTGLKSWNLYRIPMHEFEVANDVSSADDIDLSRINFARMWFEVTDSVRIDVAELEIVGNKWEKSAIRDENGNIVETDEEIFAIGVIDNQRNPHYVSPPNSTIEKNSQEILEQSLVISYENLESGYSALAYQRVTDPASNNSGMNLLSYNEMRYWLYAEYPEDEPGIEGTELIDVLFRIGADSTNYYEIRQPVTIRNYDAVSSNGTYAMEKNHWKEVSFTFSEITALKMETIGADTTRFRVEGKPTLSNIKYLAVGVDAINEFSGQLYVNEIRVANPNEDIGFAARSTFQTKFADFSDFRANLQWTSPNFQQSTDRKTRGSTSEQVRLDLSNNYNLQKFFPVEWGLNLPLSLSRNYTESVPIYKESSDILRKDLSPEEKKRQKTTDLTQKAVFNFSQSKAPRNKILAYTVKSTSISASIEKKNYLSPSSADTTWKYYAKHKYDLTIPKLKLKLLKDYHFYFLPATFVNELEYNQTNPKKWRYTEPADTTQTAYWEPVANTVDTKTVNTKTDLRYDIFDDFYGTYNLTTDRDLMLAGEWNDIPIGQEKKRNQTIAFKHSPHYIDRLFTLSSNINLKYNEDRRKQTTSDTLQFTGSVSRGTSVDFGIKNSDLLRKWGEKIAARKEQTIQDSSQTDNSNDDKDERDSEPRIEDKTENEKKEEEEEKEQKEGGEKSQDKDAPPTSTNLFAKVIFYLARLQNIGFTYSNSYETAYDYRNERPAFAYQVGLPGVLSNDELTRRKYADQYGLNSGFQITQNLSSTFSYSTDISRDYTSGNSSQTINTRYPNLSLDLSRFEVLFAKVTKLDSLLESSRLQSSFNYSKTESGEVNWKKPNSIRQTITLEPLIRWNANWIYAITTSLSYSQTTSKEETFYQNSVRRSELTQTIRSNVSYQFSAPTGLKIPFIGSKIRFDNKLTTELSFSYSKNLNKSESDTNKDTTLDKISYTITPSANYDFSQHIKGGLTGKYEVTNNKKDGEKISIMDLSLWVEITF
jgi:hypothetical protein